MVQKQDVCNGQVGALLKGDRAKMLSICPVFQKFKVLLSSVLWSVQSWHCINAYLCQ